MPLGSDLKVICCHCRGRRRDKNKVTGENPSGTWHWKVQVRLANGIWNSVSILREIIRPKHIIDYKYRREKRRWIYDFLDWRLGKELFSFISLSELGKRQKIAKKYIPTRVSDLILNILFSSLWISILECFRPVLRDTLGSLPIGNDVTPWGLVTQPKTHSQSLWSTHPVGQVWNFIESHSWVPHLF